MQKHKVLLSVVFAWLLYTGVQIISIIYMLISAVSEASIITDSVAYGTTYLSPFIWGFLLIAAAFTALFYFLTNYMISKRLNLE